ncbi:MAG: type IX secretion system membrane protein PorP/SprF [Flavobacteriales bacterium]|nr:type IX secretion system membrane protein PorP/SprF [Flavobacteriales bacterium]
MNRLFKHIIAGLVLVMATSAMLAQHTPLLSQYMTNGLPLNPAFAGSRDAFSVAGSMRSQWTQFDGAPKNQTFSIHAPMKNESLAFGVLLFNDEIGVTHETGIHAIGAYRVKLGQGRLSFGLSAGISNYRNNWNEVITTQHQDDVFRSGDDRYLLPNCGAGVYYYTRKYFVGLSAPFMLTSRYAGGQKYAVAHDFNAYDVLLNGGYRIKINETFYTTPSALVKYNAGAGIQTDINAVLGYRDYAEFGFSFRTGDAVIMLVKVKPTPQLTVGYSFDYTISNLNRYVNGAHEVTLMYDFKYKTKASSPRFF